ncbi:MAG: Uncharacterized protein G01um101416_275 [Microgenomates group bacterium Gr01-1014_16]|nr:MAG: Uncharacterized protein G01um101416_275 [Microgenomates group bacterium Gr01-1014_16]
MEMSVGKIVGQMGEGEWGQVHNFGDLVVVISFAGGAEAGREALTRIRELQHGEGLEKAVTAVMGEFGAEVGVVAVVATRVFVAGKLKTWVRRNGGKQGWLANQGVLVSNIEDGLTLTMGNERFWGCVPEGMVRTMTDAEELGAVVHGGERGRGAVGAIIKFKLQITNINSNLNDKIQIQKPERTQWWGGVRMPSIKYQVPRTPKIKPIWAGVGFLVLFAILVGGGAMWKKEIERRRSGIDEKIETIKQKFDEAKGLAGLNPVRSRELLDEVQSGISELRGIKGIAEIENEIEGVREEAMGVRRPEAEELVDLGLVRDGMTGEKMVMAEGSLRILADEGRVVEVGLKSGNGKVVAQVSEGKLYVLGNQVQIPIDKGWKEIKDTETWAGNIYLLDTDEIWVYRSNEKKDEWLDEKQDLGKSMAIDGSIWILKCPISNVQCSILKFTRGVKEMEMEIEGGDVIYTSDETDKLYVLGEGKVMVYKKTGEYESQYIFDQAKEATGMIADEQNEKLYLLSGAKIWEIGL